MSEGHLGSGFSSGARPARGQDSHSPPAGVRVTWGQDSAPGLALPGDRTPILPGGGPGAPQPQAPPRLGATEAAPGWVAHEAPTYPGPRKEATLRAGCHLH